MHDIVYSNVSRVRFVSALIGLAAVARSLSLAFFHPLNWDEIEYFRATDWIRQGLIPYRDFWEHHTPLQWFMFAPVTALIHSPGTSAILAMRWAQVPVWIATFVLLSLWMKRAGLELTSRLAVILLILCSSMFMLAAVEYRIDSMGCALYIAAVVLLQDADRDFRFAFAGGAALCLAGFANIRLGPLLALTALLFRIVRPRDRIWGGTSAANGIFAGVIATFVLSSSYFFATHSAGIALRRVWTENYLADRLSEGTPWILLHRIGVPFGLQLILRSDRLFDPLQIDLATIVIFIVGAVGIVRTLATRYRAPDGFFTVAFLQLANVLFVTAMKFIYIYHFEIIMLLMLPFVASELERFVKSPRRWAAVAAALLIVSGANVFASVFRGKEMDLAYQDLIMREADRLTPATGTVFDGVGWALRRRPAYRYWFLPTLVVNFEKSGLFESYTPEQMAADPPAAIISDYRLYTWLLMHPALTRFATTHYLPLWRNLWLPGLSARLTPESSSAEWVVPATGTYRVYGSNVLSIHPWFRQPLIFSTYESSRVEVVLSGFPPAAALPLTFAVDGKATPPLNSLSLVRGQHLRVAGRLDRPLGLLIVPEGIRALFMQPAPGVSLDAATLPVAHIRPFLNLFK